MRPRGITVGLGLALGLAAGCAAEQEREWMKLNERYTTAEFRRDLAECSRGGKLDEACMKSRGWVSVTPPKTEKATPEPRPTPPRPR